MLGRRGLLAGATALAAWPACAAPDDQMLNVAKATLAPATFDADADIERRMQGFITQSGFDQRKQDGELFVQYGKAAVKIAPTDQNWVKFRSNAYAEALLDAQASMVAEQNTTTRTQTVMKFVKGVDDPPPYTPGQAPGQAAEVIRKVLAVAGGRLDKELAELGIDPKTYSSTPVAQQTALLNDHLKSTVLQRSVGDTMGACPVKTFEGHDENGQYCVGVVIVASSKMRDFVRQVASARGEFDPNPARAQDLSAVYADEQALLADFGVRRLFDAHGLPVIISFGQWASSYHGADTTLAATYRDAARRQAELIADGQLSDFIKGSVTYERSSATGQEIDRIATSLPDSTTIDDTKRVIDEMTRSIVRTSQTQVTGLTTLRNWTGLHPASKAPVVGVIRMWSAQNQRAMRAMMGSPGVTLAPGAATPARGLPGATESRQLMNAQDF